MRPFGQAPARPGIEPIGPAPAGLVVGGYDCSAGQAGRSIPADNLYYLTSFGGGSDTQPVACAGMPPADGSWYYVADSSRFGCGTRILISNPSTGKSVVAVVADYGPNICVEQAGGKPVIDASPLVSRYLFGSDSSGYIDRRLVQATVVDPSTPLGPAGGLTLGAGIIALILAGMTGAAIWYMEALPKRNPTSSTIDSIRGIRTHKRLNFYDGDRLVVGVRKDGPGVWFVEMAGAESRSFQFAQYTPAEFTASMGSARVHGSPVAIAKMVERLMR